MLAALLSSKDIGTAIIQILLSLPASLFALSCHEAAHAYAAYKMGDRTAFNLGRMTINPIKHFDPIGSLLMLIFGFGWAKPVPINARNFKNPKKGMAITGIAGPLANLILGIISTFLMCLTSFIQLKFLMNSQISGFVFNLTEVIASLFLLSAMYNFLFMVYNLIPIPPFDGSRFITAFLPAKWYFKLMQYERYSFIIVMVINIVLSRVFGINLTYDIATKIMGLVAYPFNLLFFNLLL